MLNDHQCMQRAWQEAQIAGQKSGAVCAYEGRIIATGVHPCGPVQASCAGYNACLRAYILSGTSRNLKGVTLYITNVPSMLCIGLCLELHVDRIVVDSAEVTAVFGLVYAMAMQEGKPLQIQSLYQVESKTLRIVS